MLTNSKSARNHLKLIGKSVYIQTGNETKKSEFPFTVAIYVTPEYYNRDKERASTTPSTPARSSKRKNGGRSSKSSNSSESSSSNSSSNSSSSNSSSSSSSNKSNKSRTSSSTRKPKFNARNALRRIVRDHLFGPFAFDRHRRSKRFLPSLYPRTGYYRTRPMHQPESSPELPQSSYRTVPIRSSSLNSNYLNNRMHAYFRAPISSPVRSAVRSPSISSPLASSSAYSSSLSSMNSPLSSMNSPLNSPSRSSMSSPIVNINPSIHPSNNYAFSTENSNARNKPKPESSSTTTTDNSLSLLDDDSADEAIKQECAGSILTDR